MQCSGGFSSPLLKSVFIYFSNLAPIFSCTEKNNYFKSAMTEHFKLKLRKYFSWRKLTRSVF